MCDPPSMSWQPTISRETEYLPSEICGMGVASAGFPLSAADQLRTGAWLPAPRKLSQPLRGTRRRSRREAGQP